MAIALWMTLALIITRPDVPDEAYRALALQPQFAAAGRVVIGEGIGSGVLIGDRFFLTAAHVVRDRPVEAIQVVVGERSHAATRVNLPPEPGPRPGGLARSAGDIALIELAEPSDTPPAVLASTAARVGEVATLVGFGVGGLPPLVRPAPAGLGET